MVSTFYSTKSKIRTPVEEVSSVKLAHKEKPRKCITFLLFCTLSLLLMFNPRQGVPSPLTKGVPLLYAQRSRDCCETSAFGLGHTNSNPSTFVHIKETPLWFSGTAISPCLWLDNSALRKLGAKNSVEELFFINTINFFAYLTMTSFHWWRL